MYAYLADAVVVIHVLYVGYVVLGQLAIMIAAPFRCEWARNPWFRYTHLLAIGIVVLEVAMGWRCPLTVWEEQLRVLAGFGPNGTDSFMGKMMKDILIYDMPEVFFNTLHVATGVVVFQGILMFPPRWFRIGKRKETQVSIA